MKKVDKSMEKSTKSTNTFCRNKPNSPNVQINLSYLTTMNYTIFASLTEVKNKPNQTQFKPKTNPIPERSKMNARNALTMNYEIFFRLFGDKTKPIQTQNKPNSNLSSNVAVGGPMLKSPKMNISVYFTNDYKKFIPRAGCSTRSFFVQHRYPNPSTSSSALLCDPRLGSRIDSAGTGMDWSRTVKGHTVNIVNKLEVGVQCLVPGDVFSCMGRHASHQRCYFRLTSPPGLVMRLILPDSVQKHLPFGVVRIRIGPAKLPDKVCRDHIVAFVDLRFGLTQSCHNHSRAFGTVDVVGVGVPAAIHMPREGEQLCTIREGIFHRVVVELITRLLVAAAAHALGRDRPSPFCPAGHVDVMTVPVDEESG